MILLRCSSLGNLITKSGNFTLTAQKEAVKQFAASRWGRYDEVYSKYMEKGKLVEEDSITLLSKNLKKMFIKNTERKSDGFIIGEWDLNDKPVKHITDIKSSWSLPTFLENQIKEVKHANYWQGQGYMRLTGAEHYTVANCLVNSPASIITKEKLNKSYMPDMLDKFGNESPDYIKICQEIERNHIFDVELFKKRNPYFEFHNTDLEFSIPEELRTITLDFDRNETDIQLIEKTVIEVNEWYKLTYPKHYELL